MSRSTYVTVTNLPRQVRQMIALLLACFAVTAIVVCQVHTASFDHDHTLPSQSHRSSAPHAFFDSVCLGMAAVLPAMLVFAVFLFHVLHTTPLVLHRAAFLPAPFIPPRHTVH